jgi:thymidine kinase
MNAGKSTALIQVAYNYEENGRRVRIFTAAIDHRFGIGKVTSRIGPQREAQTFDKTLDFTSELKDDVGLSCVLIDEAQFMTPAQVRQLHRYAHTQNVPVICYGIRSDFAGEPFPGAAYLLTLADSIEEVKNICPCGKKATMNPRFDPSGRRIVDDAPQIAIEGSVSYVPMCGDCFYARFTL